MLSKNLKRNLKRHFEFSRQEVKGLLISIVLFGFMLSFREWGGQQVSVTTGLYAWFVSSMLLLIVYTFYLAVIKCLAVWKGYKMEFKLSKIIIGIALYLAFVFEGGFVLLVPGGLYFRALKKQRLGKLQQRIEYVKFGYMGAIAALVLILIAALFVPLAGSLFFSKLVTISLLVAVFSMLPLPYTTGFYLVVTSYLAFFFLLMVVGVTSLFVYAQAGLAYSLLVGFISAVCAWVLTYKYLE